jgi:hypothetical protein
LPRALSPLVEKARELAAEDQSGPAVVYRLQAGFDPRAHSVFVHQKQTRGFIH